MRIKHEIWVHKGDNGAEWDYYIDTNFAFIPNLVYTGQVFPSIVWFKNWYSTYPVDDAGNPLLEKDGSRRYWTNYVTDPRKK